MVNDQENIKRCIDDVLDELNVLSASCSAIQDGLAFLCCVNARTMDMRMTEQDQL